MRQSKEGPLLESIAFLHKENDVSVLESMAAFSEKKTHIIQGGLKEAIEYFSRNTSPKILIVDISESNIPLADLGELAEVCDPDVKVITVGMKNDVSLYRDLLKIGVSDYLISPISSEVIEKSYKAAYVEDKDQQNKSAEIISFIGARGGVGTTTFSTSYASFLSTHFMKRVAIIDMDLQFGTVGLHYNVKSGVNAEAFEDPEILDDVLLDRLLTHVNEKLSAIIMEQPLENATTINKKSFIKLLNFLRGRFDLIVLDLPHAFNEVNLFALSESETTVVVGEGNLASLRDMHKLLKISQQNLIEGKKLVLVLNKSTLYQQGETSMKDAQSLLKYPINHVIPFDSLHPLYALNEGVPLIEADGPAAEALQKFAEFLSGSEMISKQKKSLKEKVFSLFKLK